MKKRVATCTLINPHDPHTWLPDEVGMANCLGKGLRAAEDDRELFTRAERRRRERHIIASREVGLTLNDLTAAIDHLRQATATHRELAVVAYLTNLSLRYGELVAAASEYLRDWIEDVVEDGEAFFLDWKDVEHAATCLSLTAESEGAARISCSCGALAKCPDCTDEPCEEHVRL